MIPPLIQSAHETLSEMGYTVELVEETPEVPTAQLLVLLPEDEDYEGPDRVLTFTLYPDLGENLEDAELLQAFVTLPFTAPEGEARGNLARLLLNINNKLTIGLFGMREEDGLMFYRNVDLVPDHPDVWEKIVTENVFFASFYVDEFSPLIEAFVDEGLSLADAHARDPRIDPFA